MSKKYAHFLWIEQFRPQTVKDIILPKIQKIYFTKLVNAGEIKNLLLYSSSPGTGKTSLAKAICKDIDSDYLYINASKDTGIDIVRNNIQRFATVKSLSGKPKIVILDEIDSNSNKNMQKALRAFMEEFSKSCRFILTCNSIATVIEPLQSRCEIIDFNMTDTKSVEEMKPKILKRLITILKFKKVEYEENTVRKIIDRYYPDIRSMIKVCHQFSDSHDCINDEIFDMVMIDEEFFDMIINKRFDKARKYLIQKNVNYSDIYRVLFDNILPKISKENRAQAICIIGQGLRWDGMVADKEINFCACLAELMMECL